MSDTTMTVLIVDDDPLNVDLLEQVVGPLAESVLTARNGIEALSALELASTAHGFPGIVMTDLRMPEMDGLTLLERLRSIDPDLPVILLTAYGDVPTAVEAMQHGAYDFIERPFDRAILRSRAHRGLRSRQLVLENRALRAELAGQSDIAARIIGTSEETGRLRRQIVDVAATRATVLVHGETGTGKELVARCLHDFGPSRTGHFVPVNCGAIPEGLLESELFGHESGAFSGAIRRRIGKMEYAQDGTLFLDEIESMPMAHQVRLLRSLQERVIERLGSNEPIPVDFRVVVATKRDLLELSRQGEFREDLYYRLNVAELHVPALRERRGDVPLLFEAFSQEFAARHDRESRPLERSDMQALVAHDWPGNVRELRNVVERHVLGFGGVERMLEGHSEATATLAERVDAFERTLLEQALTEQAGSIAGVMNALGLPRRTLHDKMRRHGLQRRRYLDS